MSHYRNLPIDSIDDLKLLFPHGNADELNWCLFSTSGVHGTSFNLDEIERSLDCNCTEEEDDYCPPKITVLVIKPRMVTLGYGNIEITLDDIPFLRKLAQTSINQIRLSQLYNV